MSIDPLIQSSTVALIGSPNSGKTTLFNWLTGMRAKTVNYAGSTVDCTRGRSLAVYGESLHVLDTPGIYSLQPHGRDEEVTLQALTKLDDVKVCVVVLDGTQLNRQLYIVRQVQALRIPFVIGVTMMDIVRSSGRRLDLEKLSELVEAPIVEVDGRLGGGVKDLLEVARGLVVTHPRRLPMPVDLNWDAAKIESEVAISEAWTAQVVFKEPDRQSLEHLRWWDRWLLHPVWGVVAFVAIMAVLFSSIFWLAQPLMDLVDNSFSLAAGGVQKALGQGLVSDFLANGLVSGVGAVMVFVPQIFILFVGLILLEDSGYLARAATIVDRPLHKVGLSGRAFVPLLSGFACAVPAVMATRNIRSNRERWITVFIIPFMTCSARLPVYALLLSFLFTGASAWKAGLGMTFLYIGSLVVGAVAAGLLNKILKPAGDSHFLMELPFYRRPKARFVLRQAWRRTVNYVRKAGPTILVFVLLLWLGTHVPYLGSEAEPSAQLEQSLIGQMGKKLEPVFEPMGLDWRAGLGMISAFVAREVFVSSLAVIFSIADNSDSLQSGLIEKMHAATFADGTPVFTVASVWALIIYFMIALQCLSTSGVTWREMNSWKFALVQLVSMNVLAYVVGVAVFHLLQ